MAYASYYPTPTPTRAPAGYTYQAPTYTPMPAASLGPTPTKTSGPGGAYPPSLPYFENAGQQTLNSSTGLNASVLGANTTNTNTTPTTSTPTSPTPTGPSPEELYMRMLEEQYANQERAINDMEGGLGSQKSSMEQVANNTYQQGFNTAKSGYDTTKSDLDAYQAKTLQDIGESLQNMWQQGGRMLGTRGAADSSAAGMYNYAVGKLGSKQRGDVMQDVSRRATNLKSVYDTNIQNLELEKNNQMQQIAQWYGDALNQIRGMRSELQQSKSEQALNIAINMLNDARTQAANRLSILDSWAAQKAQSLPQLTQMLKANSAAMQPYQGLGAGMSFAGTPQSSGLFGFGNSGQDSLNWLQKLIPTQ